MGTWKLVAALAVVVAGAVSAFAVYTLGWRDASGDRPRVSVLREGDVVLRPRLRLDAKRHERAANPTSSVLA
jgi:hypothetical protein